MTGLVLLRWLTTSQLAGAVLRIHCKSFISLFANPYWRDGRCVTNGDPPLHGRSGRETGMLDLTPHNRAYLLRRYAIEQDDQDLECFVGLTHDESKRYLLLSDPSHENSLRDAAEFLLLDKKHDLAMDKAALWRRDHGL